MRYALRGVRSAERRWIGNSSPATAVGRRSRHGGRVDQLGLGDLRAKVIAMQGVGNVGGFMVEELPLAAWSGSSRRKLSEAVARTVRERYGQRAAPARGGRVR